jgi:guanylate kinase/ADP-ribose pyrophosphatase YjhB (NUDIX family)
MIFILSGPSGVGKSFLCKNIIKYLADFYMPQKHTTRIKRIGEDDFEYFFINETDFLKKLDHNEFIVHTNIYNHWYGLSKSEIEKEIDKNKHAIFILDVFLAQIFKEKFPDAVLIFILPTNMDELVQHLESRESLYNESVDKRIELLQTELKEYVNFNFIIPHFNGETSLELLKSIIISCFCQKNLYKKENNNFIRRNLKIYPKLAVDAVIFNTPHNKILLIERLKEPMGWALPGGFVENRETVEDALKREVIEETGINLLFFQELGFFSEPDRDPRLHVVSIAFVSETNLNAIAGGDAKSSRWFDINELPENLVFDHRKIILLAIRKIISV